MQINPQLELLASAIPEDDRPELAAEEFIAKCRLVPIEQRVFYLERALREMALTAHGAV